MEKLWLAIGFLAQAVFSARFIIQWVVSEKAGRSTVPPVFWVLSMVGGLMLLCYAIWRQDPVFILGQSTGVLIYGRNLHMIHKQARAAPE